MLGTLRFPGGDGGSNDVILKLGGGVRGSGNDGIGCRRGDGEVMLPCIPVGEDVDPLFVSSLSADGDCCCWF